MAGRRRVPLGRRVSGVILRFLLALFLRVTVIGLEHVPADGAGIVYYNHIHWLDPVLICAKLKRYAVPLTKTEASRWPIVGWLLRCYHVIFIARGAVDRAALKATWQVLADGDIAVISPEGTRGLDSRLQAAKEGLAFVARRAPDAWLLPCAVEGTPAFKWSLFAKRTPVRLTFGRPCRIRWADLGAGEGNGPAGRDALRGVTDEAMVQLAVLLPPDMRGDYADADASTPRWLESLDLP